MSGEGSGALSASKDLRADKIVFPANPTAANMTSASNMAADAINTEEGTMKVVTLKNVPDLPVEGADRIEGWTGPVSRSR